MIAPLAIDAVYCLIGLGSNLGDRSANLRAAAESIARWPEASDVVLSRVWENPACGGPPGQGDFLNAALRATVQGLTATECLERLLAIERSLGRVRTVKNGPRTIDLDLLLFGEQVIDTAFLTVPHPDMHRRPFVLLPAAEIAAFLKHPTCAKTVAELARELADVASMRPVEKDYGHHAYAHPEGR